MAETLRGLRGRWFNAWLAAAGITALVDGARLAWTDEPSPVAVMMAPDERSVAECVSDAILPAINLEQLVIATLKRSVTLEEYRSAAAQARGSQDFSLSSTLTDLAPSKSRGPISHSPFDPPAPQGRTLWDRLVRCREAIPDNDVEAVARALRGVGDRVAGNGLGFDFSRISSDPGGEKYVDPVIEYLAFSGLAFFPLRGNGQVVRVRGSVDSEFWRPTWSPALDRWGVDALLGQAFSVRSDQWAQLGLGITGRFKTVAYRGTGESDRTRAFASVRGPM